MMKRGLLSLCLLLALGSVSQTYGQTKRDRISVAFYNLENLFDTEDGENNDAEYLPDGANQWTPERYQDKLHNMAFAVSQIVHGQAPDLLGVCEIENRRVLEDLIAQPQLKQYGYRIAHFESPDRRGIDCALLYRPQVFQMTNAQPHRVDIPGESYIKTRDVLEVNGLIAGEPVSILVSHWPSRAGGEQVSMKRRKAAAQVMRHVADSLLSLDSSQKVMLMGDFNDDPTSPAVVEGLMTNEDIPSLKSKDLFNTMAGLYKSGYGTLAYRDTWNLFDNIVVSGNMIKPQAGTLHLVKDPKQDSYGQISRPAFLVQQDKQYKGYPFRTSSYGKFQNGYSDHFPVFVYLSK